MGRWDLLCHLDLHPQKFLLSAQLDVQGATVEYRPTVELGIDLVPAYSQTGHNVSPFQETEV